MADEQIKAGINRYGVGGKRVADAVTLPARHAEFARMGFEGAEEPSGQEKD